MLKNLFLVLLAISIFFGESFFYSNKADKEMKGDIRLPMAFGSSCGIYAGKIEIGNRLVISATAGQILQIQQRGNYWLWRVEFPNGDVRHQSDAWGKQKTDQYSTYNYEILSNGDLRIVMIGNKLDKASGSIWIIVCVSDWEG